MSEPRSEHGPLLAAIVKALEPYDIPFDSFTEAERLEPARKVLEALGIEPIERDGGQLRVGKMYGSTTYGLPTADEAYYPAWRIRAAESGRSGGPDD